MMKWRVGHTHKKSVSFDTTTSVWIDCGPHHAGKVQVHGQDAKAIAKEIVQLLNRTRPNQGTGFE